MARSNESSSPPGWAQALMQQIAENHRMQESTTVAQNERNAAQDERIERLEALLLSTTNTSESTPKHPERMVDTAGSLSEENLPNEMKTEIRRPRARLPDPAMFAGSSSEWPSWRTVMENKLSVDGEAIGSQQDQFAYVFSRLEKMALKNTNSFVKMQRNGREPRHLLDYLENIYGDPNLKARAARRLHLMRQREDQPFSKFLPQLEKEFADAGAFEWHDEPKRQVLLASLNRTMTETLRYRGVPSTFSELIARLHEISTDNDTLDINRPQRSHSPKTTHARTTYEPMDWTPTQAVTVNHTYPRPNRQRSVPESTPPWDQHLIGKRAKWATPDEVERRRAEGRCFRCGRGGCRIQQCPLLPAVPPKEAQSRPRVNTASMEESTRTSSEKKKKKPRVARASHPKVDTGLDEGEYFSTSNSESEKE